MITMELLRGNVYASVLMVTSYRIALGGKHGTIFQSLYKQSQGNGNCCQTIMPLIFLR